MAGLDLNLVIGAALSNSVGHVFSSIQKQASNTVKNTEKLQLGKKWAEELIYLEKRLKANDMLAQKVGRDMQSIRVRNELIKQLADAKREAEKFGINLKNAKQEAEKIGRQLNAKEAFGNLSNNWKNLKTNLTVSARDISYAYIPLKTVVGKGLNFTSAFARFEAGMSATATLLDGDKLAKKARIDVLGKAVRDMAKETGASLQDLQSGLYQTVSAFGDNEETVQRLSIATKAAIGGEATTTDAINLLSAVTKGFGDTSAEASQKAMDLAFQTVKLGQTEFPALAASMGRVIPTAATLKVKQEELFGAYATLTGVTGTASEVTTQLRGVLGELLDPSDKMRAALTKLGYANGKSILEARGLGGALADLKKAVGGNDLAFAKMFGVMEAKTAVLALTGNQSEILAEKTAAMYKSAGAAEAAYKEQQNSTENQNRRLANSFMDLSISIGKAILPTFKMMGEVLSAVAKEVGKFIEEFPFLSKIIFTSALALTAFNFALKMFVAMKNVVEFIKALELAKYKEIIATKLSTAAQWLWNHAKAAGSGIVGGFLGVLGSLKIAQTAGAVATKIATAAQWLWNAALTANPIGMIIVGIGVFAALAYTVYKNWEPILGWFNEALDRIKRGWDVLFGGDDEKTISTVSKFEDLNSGGSNGSISVVKDIPVQPTSVKNEKNVNVSMPNITINSANLDESLPTITEKVRAAVMAGVKDEMENSYAY